MLANAGKAFAVGGLEVFADPLGPLGKASKLKGATKLIDADKLAQVVKRARASQAMNVLKKVRGPSTAEQLAAKGAKVITPTNIVKSK
jgi:hypothetical protein